SGIFSAAHVAGENDRTFFRRCGGETLRGFFISHAALRTLCEAPPFCTFGQKIVENRVGFARDACIIE
ncbi:MAG: hypothetical protein UET87_06450, partial [Oscillospiraceae bacterium]|nr:hypothetical protein [Oscillospiraceae bacterium]